ncbi:putative dnaJ subfamily C member 27-like protein [Cricetulus griseus]|nr:putative dnaJ subfamily C member 27-like protein [Cricetulus griseus]
MHSSLSVTWSGPPFLSLAVQAEIIDERNTVSVRQTFKQLLSASLRTSYRRTYDSTFTCQLRQKRTDAVLRVDVSGGQRRNPKRVKSCIIKRYCEKRFVSKYLATIGIDYGVTKSFSVSGGPIYQLLTSVPVLLV